MKIICNFAYSIIVRSMKRIVKCLSLSACVTSMLVLGLTGCGNKKNEDKRPVLAVSVEPQRYLLDKLVGDNFRIITVLPNGENPETFDPSPSKRIAVENADVYFTTGHLIFETNLKLSSNEDVLFVNTSDSITPIYGTHTCHNHHRRFLQHANEHVDEREADPHVWVSLRNAGKMSKVMAETLKKLDPENASEYDRRAKALQAQLDSLDKDFTTRLDDAGNPAFMVWHPSLSYFARDYGLEQVAVNSETKEVSVNQLRSAIDEALSDSVNIFFYQNDLDSRQAEALSTGAGCKRVPINTAVYEWVDELKKIVNELTNG